MKNFKVGDRIIGSYGPGTIVDRPEAFGPEYDRMLWVMYDSGRGPYWTGLDSAEQFWEFETKESDMSTETLTDRVHDLINLGHSADEIREALARAAEERKHYERGYQAGLEKGRQEVPAVERPRFVVNYDGALRSFEVVGIKESGYASGYHGLLVVLEHERNGEIQDPPQTKTYGFTFPKGHRIYTS